MQVSVWLEDVLFSVLFLSPTFKAREFKVQESSPFSVVLAWKGSASVYEDDSSEQQQMTVAGLQMSSANKSVLNPSRDDSFISWTKLKDVQNEQETTDPLGPLQNALEVSGLITEQIDKELGNDVEYWTLGRSFCNAASEDTEISIQDALRVLKLRSFNYRVLNLLCMK